MRQTLDLGGHAISSPESFNRRMAMFSIMHQPFFWAPVGLKTFSSPDLDRLGVLLGKASCSRI